MANILQIVFLQYRTLLKPIKNPDIVFKPDSAEALILQSDLLAGGLEPERLYMLGKENLNQMEIDMALLPNPK